MGCGSARSPSILTGAPVRAERATADATKHEAALAQIRRQIDVGLCTRAEEEGRAMPLGEVLDRAETAFA
jgi:hypothetical protein